VNHEQITLTQILKGCLQLWPCRVLAGGFVGKRFVQLHALKLALGVLVKAADPDIP
jgi:hypothetical protein